MNRRILIASMFLLVGVFVFTNSASASFLCPVVGDGVVNADNHNGDNGVEAIEPPVGTSLLPAKTTEEARELIKAGFEYVCAHESIMIFRKRK